MIVIKVVAPIAERKIFPGQIARINNFPKCHGIWTRLLGK